MQRVSLLSTDVCSFDALLLHCKNYMGRGEVSQFGREIIGGIALTWSVCACVHLRACEDASARFM